MDQSNENAQLLNFVYQNSQMGVDTITELMDITTDDSFKERLHDQLKEYRTIHDRAARMLEANGFNEEGLSAFEKIRTYLMINFQTLSDDSVSHIAEMLIVGSTMGIIQALRNIHRYSGKVERDILELMEYLRNFEENNVERFKAWL
ncbi:hypothetical protein LI177_02205 [bacterium 210820-DFI.6.37]|nr:hypothetical protein [bacterium 210820-DFI.6.37]